MPTVPPPGTPAGGSPINSGGGSYGIATGRMRHGGKRRAGRPEGRRFYPPKYYSKVLDGLTFPFGVSVLTRVEAEWLAITPGLAYVGLGGANFQLLNTSCGMRLYETTLSADGEWISGYANRLPPTVYHAGLFAGMMVVPWEREVQLFAEFIGAFSGAIPANSFLEFTVAPFDDE